MLNIAHVLFTRKPHFIKKTDFDHHIIDILRQIVYDKSKLTNNEVCMKKVTKPTDDT